MFPPVSSLSVISTCNYNLVPGCTWTDAFGAQMGPYGTWTDTIVC